MRLPAGLALACQLASGLVEERPQAGRNALGGGARQVDHAPGAGGGHELGIVVLVVADRRDEQRHAVREPLVHRVGAAVRDRNTSLGQKRDLRRKRHHLDIRGRRAT